MEFDESLLEYSKLMLTSIRKGASIYLMKLKEEKNQFDENVGIIIENINRTKEEFIRQIDSLDNQYTIIASNAESILMNGGSSPGDIANDLNSKFCMTNKEYEDFKNGIKNKLFDNLSINLQKLNNGDLKQFSSKSNCIKITKEDPNSQRETCLSPIKSDSVNFPPKNSTKCNDNTSALKQYSSPNNKRSSKSENKNEYETLTSSNIVNQNLCYAGNRNNDYKENSGMRHKKSSPKNKKIEHNKDQWSSDIKYESNFNNCDWDKFDWNVPYNDTNCLNSWKSDNENSLSQNKFEPNNNTFQYSDNSTNKNNKKFLSNKRSKPALPQNLFNIFSNPNNIDKKQRTETGDSPPENENIAKILKESFPDLGIDFISILNYLKCKTFANFEFNVMNSATVCKQIENLMTTSKELKEDFFILIQIKTKADNCSTKSPLFCHVRDLFVMRYSSFRNDELFIGGISSLKLTEFYSSICSDSFLNYHTISSIKMGLYVFIEDILNDIDDINGNSISHNFNKQELADKRSLQIIIRNIRKKYAEIVNKF